MNAEVVDWKTSKPNQFQARALVEGTFLEVTTDRSSHFHFSVQIGPDAKRDVVEIVYNKKFGNFPTPYKGMKVSACGDFINAFKASGGYPASPAGAIIHWVHVNPGERNSTHPDGYVVMDGELVGHNYSRNDSGDERSNGSVASTAHKIVRDSEAR